ncbi:uncharacterized protein LOC135329766 [Dromaius novaehollandiae]|uniref:uncharacterized protein LOC135329766 n=1 Tax=Dromaius novaehollandiae TaxID=8790 RepID=UPI00311FC665
MRSKTSQCCRSSDLTVPALSPSQGTAVTKGLRGEARAAPKGCVCSRALGPRPRHAGHRGSRLGLPSLGQWLPPAPLPQLPAAAGGLGHREHLVQRLQTPPGDEQRASGCRARGGFLCYDLSCRPCGEAARERQRQLEAEAWQSPWASSRPQSPSSEDSSPWRAHSERRRLPARHRGLPQRGPGTPRPLPPATAPTVLELRSQADKLAGLTHALPERAVSPQAGSPTALGSRLAEGAGSLPGGTDPRPVSRLKLGHKIKKRLRMHLIKKCTEIRLAGFPAVVQASWEVSICSLGHPAAPPPLRSTTAPKYFHTAEALFLPEEARETLELHIRAKRLQHQQSLSKESPAAHVPQAPVSAHQEQRQETPVQLPAQHPPCLPQATKHRAEPQPEPFPPERDNNSGQEEKKRQGSDTQGRMWRLRNTKGAVTYTAQRLSQSPRATRWTILRVLVLHPPSKGSFS